MAKGLGVNQQSNQKPSNAVPDGNKGWAPQPKGNRKLGRRLNINATPTIKNQG